MLNIINRGGFNIKECCKNCKDLNYYDGYFCSLGKGLSEEARTEIDYTINDIETEKCEMFSKRNGRFWLMDNGEF